MSGLATTAHGVQRPSADLQIHLLGPPEVAWQGEPLALSRRQVRGLLYYLAAAPSPAPRDTLCFLFWPDSEQATARHNLSRLLTLLHSTLPDSTLLLARDDQVALHRQRIWTDAGALADCCTAWSTHGAVVHLQQAAALYRGPFLAGFCLPDSLEFDAWMVVERERWTRQYLQVLGTLVETLAVDAGYLEAIEYAERYLAADELAEDMHRRLIELYTLAGNRSAALQQYERCVTALERELGVDPAPETQAVYRAILQRATLGAVPALRPQWTAPAWPDVQAPLIGRAAEIRALDEAYRQARVGRGGAILIAGEPGVGKSRLMHEFAGRVRSQALVLTGCCYAETRTAPYQPLVEALRPHLNMHRFEFDAYPSWLADLAQLFVELRPLHPNLPHPPVTEPGWARTRLFEALEALLVRLAHGVAATILCLDDLHWADSATLDWLSYLGCHLHSRPLLLVGAYRAEEAAALAGLRSSLARQGALRELALDGLDAAATSALVQHLGGSLPADPAVAGRLHQATSGNPFFLLEILGVLVEAGRWPPASPAELPLPDSVRQAVRLRVEQLSPAARQVLEAAAVVGQVFTCDTLYLTAGRAELETADALDELAGRQFLAHEPGGGRFRHEIVREVVYQSLSAYRRGLLHRRAGEALERLHPEDAAALARHFEHAGLPDQAARHALQAGLAAKKVHAPVETLVNLDHALALLRQAGKALRDPAAIAANQRMQIEALGERGWALRLLGDMTAYARDLEEEGQLAGILGDPATLAHWRWRQASAHLWFCRHDAARVAAQDGLRLSRAAGDRFLEAACLRAAGLAARAAGDYDSAQSSLEQALSIFAALDQASYQVHTLGNLSTLWLQRGDPAQALALAQQALSLCEAAGLQVDRRIPLGDMGAAAAALGEVELARQRLAESLAIAHQISDRTQEILCLGHLGWLDVQRGQAAAALEHLRAALALAEQVNSCAEQPWLHAGLAEALRLAGDLAAAAHARQALALACAAGQAHDQRLAKWVLAGL
jgi:DNA-binding SARP family transcriptional activator